MANQRLQISIFQNPKKIAQYMSNPKKLPYWTVHRAIFKKEFQFYEIRTDAKGNWKSILLDIEQRKLDSNHYEVTFLWNQGRFLPKVVFCISASDSDQKQKPASSQVHLNLSKQISQKKFKTLRQLIRTELKILKNTLEQKLEDIRPRDWKQLQAYHLMMYTKDYWS
ncbi:MAG: hypothetical protein H7A32_00145 [Deltaproteobacteria bacterium]|nr:hypothetical protein [Deltaproteobacteria bacterium]